MESITQELLDHCSKYAMELLTETGELFPFGALTDASGRTHHREFEVDPKNIPPNGKIMEILLQYFEDEFENQEAQAFAMAFESSVQVEESLWVDAITIDLKSKTEKEIPLFYFPFKMQDDGNVVFDEPFAVKRNSI